MMNLSSHRANSPSAAPLPARAAPTALEASSAFVLRVWASRLRSVRDLAAPGIFPLWLKKAWLRRPRRQSLPSHRRKGRRTYDHERFQLQKSCEGVRSPTVLPWRGRSECALNVISVACVGSFPHPVLCLCFECIGTSR